MSGSDRGTSASPASSAASSITFDSEPEGQGQAQDVGWYDDSSAQDSTSDDDSFTERSGEASTQTGDRPHSVARPSIPGPSSSASSSAASSDEEDVHPRAIPARQDRPRGRLSETPLHRDGSDSAATTATILWPNPSSLYPLPTGLDPSQLARVLSSARAHFDTSVRACNTKERERKAKDEYRLRTRKAREQKRLLKKAEVKRERKRRNSRSMSLASLDEEEPPRATAEDEAASNGVRIEEPSSWIGLEAQGWIDHITKVQEAGKDARQTWKTNTARRRHGYGR
ncbi:unnamed protein product [Jaminaea pallidilutea]